MKLLSPKMSMYATPSTNGENVNSVSASAMAVAKFEASPIASTSREAAGPASSTQRDIAEIVFAKALVQRVSDWIRTARRKGIQMHNVNVIGIEEGGHRLLYAEIVSNCEEPPDLLVGGQVKQTGGLPGGTVRFPPCASRISTCLTT